MNYFKKQNIIIAYDTRNSNQTLLFNLSSGILAGGINVIDAGVIPTSAVAYYTYLKNMIGIMITASHNLYKDNGIKIFKNGKKINNNDIYELEKLIDNGEICNNIECGRYYKSYEPLELYKNFLKSFINKYHFKVIFDSANGVCSSILADLFSSIDNVIFLGNHPNGYNINNTGCMEPKYLKDKVRENNFDLGFAYDGDGDRVIMVSNNGYIYSGGELAFIIAKYLDKYSLLKNKKIVLSKMTNLGIINAFKENGFEVYLSEVGDSNLFLVMENISSVIGGEPSGHIILKDFLPTGDGILTSIFLLNIFSCDPLMDLKIKKYPEIEKNYLNKNSDLILNNLEILNYINDFHNNYPTTGKIILRKSGTENLVRLYVSHINEDILNNTFKNLNNLICSLI